MTDIYRLARTFQKIGVRYVIVTDNAPSDYSYLFPIETNDLLASNARTIDEVKRMGYNRFFEFEDGKLISY